jgi:hypothetical protein
MLRYFLLLLVLIITKKQKKTFRYFIKQMPQENLWILFLFHRGPRETAPVAPPSPLNPALYSFLIQFNPINI